MEVETSRKCIDKTTGEIWQLIPNATYRFNKTIATATIRFIVTVAIVVYEGLTPVVYRMLTYLEELLFFVIIKKVIVVAISQWPNYRTTITFLNIYFC